MKEGWLVAVLVQLKLHCCATASGERLAHGRPDHRDGVRPRHRRLRAGRHDRLAVDLDRHHRRRDSARVHGADRRLAAVLATRLRRRRDGRSDEVRSAPAPGPPSSSPACSSRAFSAALGLRRSWCVPNNESWRAGAGPDAGRQHPTIRKGRARQPRVSTQRGLPHTLLAHSRQWAKQVPRSPRLLWSLYPRSGHWPRTMSSRFDDIDQDVEQVQSWAYRWQICRESLPLRPATRRGHGVQTRSATRRDRRVGARRIQQCGATRTELPSRRHLDIRSALRLVLLVLLIFVLENGQRAEVSFFGAR